VADPGADQGGSRIARLVLFGTALLFFAALAWLFALRLENGDFLPSSSSLRKDPMGTAVLYESLLKSGMQVERNHDPLSKAMLNPGETFLIIGHRAEPISMFREEATRELITSFVEQGGRLVITTGQVSSSDSDKKSKDTSKEKSENKKGEQEHQMQPSGDPAPDDAGAGAEDNDSENAGEKKFVDEPAPPWAVRTGYPESSTENDIGNSGENSNENRTSHAPHAAFGVLAGKALTVTWPDRLVFKELDVALWQAVLSVDDEPVLIERRLGKGSIVLATSSFFLSNEAMLRDRQVALITWLTGSPDRLIFDEFHHGLRSRKTVVGLVRSHNLHGIIIGLFLLAVLFLWKNSSSLLPRSGGQKEQIRHHIGRNQFEGLVNILRLHHPDNLVHVALRQWEKGNRKWCDSHPEQLETMRKLAASPETTGDREEQQVKCYRAISRILNENNKRTHQ
jgi:hypothetical protein